jgi:hypothetical protein
MFIPLSGMSRFCVQRYSAGGVCYVALQGEPFCGDLF